MITPSRLHMLNSMLINILFGFCKKGSLFASFPVFIGTYNNGQWPNYVFTLCGIKIILLPNSRFNEANQGDNSILISAYVPGCSDNRHLYIVIIVSLLFLYMHLL